MDDTSFLADFNGISFENDEQREDFERYCRSTDPLDLMTPEENWECYQKMLNDPWNIKMRPVYEALRAISKEDQIKLAKMILGPAAFPSPPASAD